MFERRESASTNIACRSPLAAEVKHYFKPVNKLRTAWKHLAIYSSYLLLLLFLLLLLIFILIYRAIHKSLRDFRPLRYCSRDGHAEGKHVNRGRDSPSFCPSLQVLDMSTLGDAADVNPVIKFLSHTLYVCGRNSITVLTSAASPRVDISSTCKVGQKLGLFLPLLTFSPSAWPSRLLYRRGRKSQKDLWITL
jgi:hypothetical protein